MLSRLALCAALAATLAAAGTGEVKCPIIFDGRVPAALEPSAFDSDGNGNPYGAEYVKGQGLKWSQILRFPAGAGASRFENATAHKPLEVTIGDGSVFQNQRGFRRAGLQFAGDANTGSPGTRGLVTLHFSVKQDAARPLNLSHEYLNVWHETSDYSADQVMFQVGTLIGQERLPRDTFKVMSRDNRQLWSTPVDAGAWQNFAIQMDYRKNTVQVYYSKDDAPLEVVLKATSNNMAGEGQYQLGMLKKPTGTSDVVNSGYQEGGIDEGQIYGSVFLEDSSNGCVSL